MTAPEKAWDGERNHIDTLELIAITEQGATIVAARPPQPQGDAFSELVEVQGTGVVLRARGRSTLRDGSSLMFYTNPIRVTATSAKRGSS